MSIKVKKFINENTTVWDNFINASNNGTLFHYRSFLNYHENIQFNDHSLLFYEDNKLIALLPAAIKNDEFCSHPGISFGGFIFDKHLSFSNANNIIKSFMVYINKINCKKIKITIPPDCYSQEKSDYIEFCLTQYNFKYEHLELSNVLKLGNNFDILYQSYKPSARQATRKADKSGVVISKSENLNEFYDILTNNLSLRHNVTPTHTLSELKKLKNLFPDQITLFTAALDNQMIAGILNFICNDNTVLAFYISHNTDFQNVRPLNMLFTHIFKWAINSNYQFYDFGLFTVNGEPNESLARFKESFGTDGMFRKTMVLEL